MTHTPKIRIMIVEDHPLYRVGLKMALSYSTSDFTIVEESKNVKEAVDYIRQNPDDIDVILLDYFLPDGNGDDVVDAVREFAQEVKILLISAETNFATISSLVGKGINGFISKDVTPQELALVITSIYHGHDYFDKTLMQQLESSSHDNEKDESFSERELDIVRLSAQGLTAKQIADQLRISPRTVEKHKDRIFSKFCFKSTAEMVNYAVRKGLV